MRIAQRMKVLFVASRSTLNASRILSMSTFQRIYPGAPRPVRQVDPRQMHLVLEC
jgi:hypothetical protein